MIRCRFREISTLALLAAMTAGPAMAQEALPDIEVGKPKAARPSSKPKKPAVAHVAAPALPVAAPSSPVVAPPPKSEVERAEEKFDATQKASSEQFTTGKQINACRSVGLARRWKRRFPVSWSRSIAARARPINISFAASSSITAPTSRSTLDGMPLNMPTHGHGQGYADANFLIPELFSYVIGKKGPYFADEGDFSAAGAVHIQYKDDLPGGLFSATAGSFDYGRLLGDNLQQGRGRQSAQRRGAWHL